MTPPILTLLTDFGTGSPYVAEMKASILSRNRQAVVVDITHDVPPQDVLRGALLWADVTPRFPADSIHVAVVDPGVGTRRRLLYARLGGRHYVAPDNGLLTRLAEQTPPDEVRVLQRAEYWQQPVSSTFHGRDVMAPVAAHVSLGVSPERLGPPVDDWIRLEWPAVRLAARSCEGHVLWVDGFGNLISNIEARQLGQVPPSSIRVTCGERRIEGLVSTYGDRPVGELVALFGSQGRLEVAVVGGSAAARLNAGCGTPLRVGW